MRQPIHVPHFERKFGVQEMSDHSIPKDSTLLRHFMHIANDAIPHVKHRPNRYVVFIVLRMKANINGNECNRQQLFDEISMTINKSPPDR